MGRRVATNLSWALLIGLCSCTSVTQPGSAASCAAPWLSTIPNSTVAHHGPGVSEREAINASPGQTLRIYGYGYQTCHDTNHEPLSRPLTQLTVFVVQGHIRQAVATVSASHPYGDFAATIHLPPDLRPGPATIETSLPAGSETAHLQIQP